MSLKKALIQATCLLAMLFTSGCTLLDGGKNWLTGKRTDQTEPELTDEKWMTAGREARASRPAVKEDLIDRWMWSDKAREINRNVGFD